MKPRHPCQIPAAFSLVETTLAVGILSFALVAILGLLSVGIDAARGSADDTQIAFIMQDVASRVRSEVSSLNLPADATRLDLTWNRALGGKLDYALLRDTVIPVDPLMDQRVAATAYYTVGGQIVRQQTVVAPTRNYYKATISVQPLASYPFPLPTLASAGSSGPDFPYLAVMVKVGWPTDNQVNGSVEGPVANASKSIFTFYLPKP